MTVLEQGVRELLEEFIDVPADAFAQLHLEALTIEEILQELSERFAVKVPDEHNPENFRSVSSIVAFVTKHRSV